MPAQLTPDLGGNDFPDDRYSFEWRTLARSADETVTVIGTSRNLDYEVALPAGAYTLFFKVTEDASGVYWQTSSELQVSEATSEGWMVLCADGDDDRARLDMVSAVTGETYTDLLKDNGMPEMKGPRRHPVVAVRRRRFALLPADRRRRHASGPQRLRVEGRVPADLRDGQLRTIRARG